MTALQAILIVVGCFTSCFCQKPEIILYNTKASGIPTYKTVTNLASENQGCLPQEIKASRICVVAGVWLFYSATSYNPPTEDVGVYMRNEADANSTCRDLPTWLDKAVGSYRFVGDSSNVTASALSLYGGTYYRLTEVKLNSSASEVPYAFNSLIRLGNDRWQFYMKENYEGFSECLDEDEHYIVDFTERFGVQPGDIKSIKQGCDKS